MPQAEPTIKNSQFSTYPVPSDSRNPQLEIEHSTPGTVRWYTRDRQILSVRWATKHTQIKINE